MLAGNRVTLWPLSCDIGFRIKEDRISIDDVLKNYEHGELWECFGTGTAATVSHVRRIRYKRVVLCFFSPILTGPDHVITKHRNNGTERELLVFL